MLEIETGKSITLYGKPSTRALSAKWSPDGQWIAFIAQETERDEIYLVRPNGEGLHQLTNTGHDVFQFEWSPNGKQLAVIFNRNGAFDLSLVEVETGSVIDLRSGTGIHSNPNWSQDGSFITFEYESPLLPPDLYRMDLSSKQVTQLTFSNPACTAEKQKGHAGDRQLQKLMMAWKSLHSYIARKNQTVRRSCIRMADPRISMVISGMSLPNTSQPRATTYLAPNYRGSTGYGKQFERANYDNWGVGDTQDCLYGAKFLRGCPGDPP